jgi:hypothetical protein
VVMRFGPELKTAWVRVPVRLEPGPGVLAATSQKYVRVQVEGPVAMLREAEQGRDIQGLAAVLKLPGGMRPGRHALRYDIEAPAGFRVISRQTQTIDVSLHK